jgi:peptide/nickel transport system ATP-binding protein
MSKLLSINNLEISLKRRRVIMRLLETSVMIYMKMKFWESLVSRSGKSVSSLAIMGLLPAHISKISKVALFSRE